MYLKNSAMTSLRYGRIFCLEIQKIDGTEYLNGIDRIGDFLKIIEPRSLQLNLEGLYKIENE